jgi:TRAP-type C4-dicarboxylate transport system substrate-binding protein
MSFRSSLAAALLLLLQGRGHAEPVQLRMSTIAPEGTSWARAIKAFSHEVEALTDGRIHLKWYWGGLAGDELQVFDRIQREQLDGQVASLACVKLAPSLRVLRLAGIFRSAEEQDYVLGLLRGELTSEFRRSGFIGFVANIGEGIVFSRAPVRTMTDLRKLHPWTWTLDEVSAAQLRLMGMNPVLTPIESAARAYESGAIDAFITIPSAALAFQWSQLVHGYTELKFGTIPSCVVIASKAFDALSIKDQEAVREAAARLGVRGQDLGRETDGHLLQIFAKQGMVPTPPDAPLQAEFSRVAREAAHHLPPEALPPELLKKVETWLDDHRQGGEKATSPR